MCHLLVSHYEMLFEKNSKLSHPQIKTFEKIYCKSYRDSIYEFSLCKLWTNDGEILNLFMKNKNLSKSICNQIDYEKRF